jgi:hypothetical protein
MRAKPSDEPAGRIEIFALKTPDDCRNGRLVNGAQVVSQRIPGLRRQNKLRRFYVQSNARVERAAVEPNQAPRARK